jgi:hypothetical protein
MEDGLETRLTSVASWRPSSPDEVHFAHDAEYIHRGHAH